MWNPDATCPRVDQFLADVLPDDTVDLMIELIGYALYAGNPLAKAVLLLGPAGNGKSKLLMLIRALLGDANVSSIPLQTLSENRFAAAQIYGKLANICGDLDARSIKRSDLFKQITGGDVIMAEHKYGHPFNFTSYALPIFSANEAPLSSDQTEAWFDRWLIVPMEARFRGTDREDPFIEPRSLPRSNWKGYSSRPCRRCDPTRPRQVPGAKVGPNRWRGLPGPARLGASVRQRGMHHRPAPSEPVDFTKCPVSGLPPLGSEQRAAVTVERILQRSSTSGLQARREGP